MTAFKSERRQQRRNEAADRLAASELRLCGHMHVAGGVDRCRTASTVEVHVDVAGPSRSKRRRAA